MLNDLRYAFRLLGNSPGFTAVAVLALGIGIGLATAVFTAFSGLMLHPAPLVPNESTGDIVTLLRMTLAAVVLVLLIACANVANLLLAKAATRGHEMAIRASLGATRGRIVRQVLTESLLLGLLGGVAGLLVGVWANSLMISVLPNDIPSWMTFDFDWRVFLFTAGSAVASALMFGLIPALHISHPAAAELKEGGRGSTRSARTHRLRNILVVAQVAIAFVFLIGAGLMVRSFINLQQAESGIKARDAPAFRAGLQPNSLNDSAAIRSVFDDFYWKRRFVTQLGAALAVGALFLATLGIYGVMTSTVTQRTQEIGVRMALGAQPQDVVRMINREGLRLVGLGLAIGLTAAMALMHYIGVFLYGVSPHDPPTYFLLSLVVISVALIASRLPARRATQIAPMTALRDE